MSKTPNSEHSEDASQLADSFIEKYTDEDRHIFQQIDEIWEKYDLNGDGVLNFEEAHGYIKSWGRDILK